MPSKNDQVHWRTIDKKFDEIGFRRNVNQSSESRHYYQTNINQDGEVEIKFSIRIDTNTLLYNFYLYHEVIDYTFVNFPGYISDDTINDFCARFNEISVCCGISGFKDLIENRCSIKEPFPNSASIESSTGHINMTIDKFDIIRSVKCTKISAIGDVSGLCVECQALKSN